MTLAKSCRVLLPTLLLLLAACGSPQSAEPAPVPTAIPTMAPTVAPTTAPTPEPPTPEPPAVEEPTPESASEPTTAPEAATAETEAPAAEAPAATQLSFTPATYTDESAGFALDYPADWTVDPSSQIGVRGGQALLLSPGTTVEALAEGGTRVAIVIYIWDPKNDLDAYVTQRKVAWDASGFAIVREETLQLADGRAAYAFVINTPEQPSFMLFTTVGEDYLQIAGDGDMALVEEIARTLRPVN